MALTGKTIFRNAMIAACYVGACFVPAAAAATPIAHIAGFSKVAFDTCVAACGVMLPKIGEAIGKNLKQNNSNKTYDPSKVLVLDRIDDSKITIPGTGLAVERALSSTGPAPVLFVQGPRQAAKAIPT